MNPHSLDQAGQSRVLVVDNYDSFTFNLVQGFEKLLRAKVRVVKNDSQWFVKTELEQTELISIFDLIVLSPGPGNPRDDVGCVTKFILDYYFSHRTTPHVLPVLFGVCMGYEAIGVYLGVPVIKTVPRHGLRWSMHIDHVSDAQSLFRGLPDVFEQVRYHSLILCPDSLKSCPELIITAWAFDEHPSSANLEISLAGPMMPPGTPGWISDLSLRASLESVGVEQHGRKIQIPMAFRHATLPVYGVQFNPESILSDFGTDILRNVCRLSGLLSDSSDPPAIAPRITSDSPITRSVATCTRLTTIPLPLIDQVTERLFTRYLHANSTTSVWLDSPVGTTGRWSYLASGDADLTTYCQRNGRVTLGEGSDWLNLIDDREEDNFLNRLSSIISKQFQSATSNQPNTSSTPPCGVPAIFTCMGYETYNQQEGKDGTVEAVYIVAKRFFAIDNFSGNIFSLHLPNIGDDSSSDLIRLCIDECMRAAAQCPPLLGDLLHFQVSDSKECYLEKIKTAQAAIERGESYELCLTTTITGQIPTPSPSGDDGLRIYRNLRRLNPAPNSAYFSIPSCGIEILSASPERFLRVSDLTAQVKPIKGTRRRGATDAEDEELRKELEGCAKDCAENLMIVDLVRNDLAVACADVVCPTLMQVETYSPYHQLVSTVEAKLAGREDVAGLVKTLFPAGSMTGAPKVRSMALLSAIEGRPRGIGYSGALGFLSPTTGDADLAVVIRTILLSPGDPPSTRSVSLGCGGAILALSDPIEEWKEMLLKARRNLAALAVGYKGVILKYSDDPLSGGVFIRAADLSSGEVFTSMRYEVGRGVWLLDRHLKRLAEVNCDVEVMKEKVVRAIHKAAERCDCPASNLAMIGEGPFVGIGEVEWEDIGELKFANAKNEFFGCKIRVDVIASRDGGGEVEIKCTFSPLPTTGGCMQVRVSPVRVDSGDTKMKRKCADWYVPGVGGKDGIPRGEVLLVDECDRVTETGIANVAMKRQGGEWITPCAADHPMLPGVMRSLLLDKGYVAEGTLGLTEFGKGSLGERIAFNAVRGVFNLDIV